MTATNQDRRVNRRRRAGTRRIAPLAALFAAALAGAPFAAWAASSHGGGHHDEHAEPVPTGAALTERCAEYAEQLAFTREQLKRRNVLGRWNLVVSEHRKRERFHDRYCGPDAASHGTDAHHAADAGHETGAGHGRADH